jgi:hypothetical protein
MDLSDPDRLREHVASVAHRVARSRNLYLDDDAIEALVAPGLGWDRRELASVDLDRLEDAIAAVVYGLPPPLGDFRPVDRRGIRSALSRSACHYLWFC